MYQIQQDKLAYFNKEINSYNRKITYRLTLNDKSLPIDKVMDNLVITTDSGLEQYGVGSALVAQLQMSIKKEVRILPKDKIKVEIGLEIFNEVSQQWETIYSPLGVFFVDTIEETGVVKKLKAYDGMYKLNKGYFPSSKHTTTQAIANDIANANGYRVTGVINVGINNEQLEGKNCNEMLSLVASAMGRNVRINRSGDTIEFVEPINTNLTFNENHLSTATLDDTTSYNITKLRINYSDKVTNDKGEVTDEGYFTVGEGTDANTLELNNPLLKGQQAQANSVLIAIKKLNGYKRFDTTMPLADYRLEPMDMVTYSKGGVNYLVPILYSKMVLSYQGISIETQSPTLAPTKSEFSFKGTLTQKVENLYTDIIQVKQLTANKVTTDELEATVATIEKLYAKKAEINELVAGTIIVESLKAQVAEIDKLVANKADINQLTALNATINSLKAQVAEIDNLIAGSILSQIIQSGSISSDLLNVKDGFIKDAMISSLSASKINSGVINTNNVLITSDNGNMTLQGNLLQFKDKSGKVRIQIGQDTKGNYTFTLYDSTGKGVLINEQGIQSSNAIKDGLIVDSKVAGNANISGSKLNISSLYDSMNADGSKTLKASKVHLDDKGQTLDVSFKEMTTKQDGLENTMNTAITDISVSKGQISQLIQDTTITTANGTTTLKDAYNTTKSTVDSHTTSIGNMQSTINSHTGEIQSVKSETASVKAGLNKIELDVKTNYHTKEEVTDKINSAKSETKNYTDSAIKVATDSITQSVSSTYETKTEVANKFNNSISESKKYTDSQITVAKNEINLGVSQTYETKTNVESKVNTGLNNAKSYADTKKQEAINSASTDATNKVNNAKNELNTAISKKANSSDVYTKTEVYTKAQTDSQIQIAKDAINLGVSQNYETKTEVTNKVNTAVNGIQIGGRNLAQKTSSSYSAPYTSFNGSNNICPSLAKVLTDGLSVGDTVTVRLVYKYNNVVSVSGQTAQCWIQGSGNVTAWNQGGFESPPKKTINGSGEIEFLYNFKITSKHLQNAYWDTSIRHDYVQSGSIQFKMFKVEKGTKPSDWSPAPEDVNTAIENTKSETKSYTDSKIQLAKNEIDLSVKTNYETKTEVSNKVNKAIDSVRVGGRNLIIRHNELKNMMVGADGTFSTYNGSSLMSTYIEVTEGESLMFTQTFQGDGDNYFRYAFYAEDRRTVVQRTPNNSKTFNVFVPKTAKWLRVSYDTSNLVKIERGNKASDWSPAPEDVDASITTAKNEVKEYTNSQIKLAKNEIDLSVKGTYETKTEVTNKVNGIQIGARNLLVKDALESGNLSGVDGSVIGGDYPNFYRTKNFIDIDNKSKYVLKLNKSKSGDKIEKIIAYASNNTYISTHEINSMETVFTPPINCQKIKFVVVINSTSASTIVYDSKIMLEKGTKATDWTPAPEDVDASITSVKSESKEYTDSKIQIAKNAITQSVSSTYETKSDATNKINGVNSSISSLTNRVASAESKITEDAITNTVKKNFYTKEQTEGQITSKGYVTSSQLQQSSNSLTATFSSSGGYNLLKNGKASLDTSFWVSNGGGISRSGDSIYGTCFQTAMPSGIRYAGGESSTPYAIRLKNNTHYVYQAMVYAGASQIGHSNTPLHFWCTTSHTTAGHTQCSVVDYSQQTIAGKWEKCYVHIVTASSGEVWFSPFVYGLGSGQMWVTELALIESRVPLPYTPHPNEIYDGITNISKTGIVVRQSNVGSYTQMSASGFYVLKNDGNKLFEATNKVALYNGKGVSCVEIVNDPSANYGNARIDVRGGINFVHNPGQSTGTNQILLGNHDVSNQYGMHNMSIRAWNSLGFQDNNGYTNMFFDTRRGRMIMKGALYQNTATPPSMFSMNFDGEDEVYNSGFTRDMAVDSIMNLKTGVYVDNEGECCSAIYGGHDELITTEYVDEDGITSTHLNVEALNASLVVTCQEQQRQIEEQQVALDEQQEILVAQQEQIDSLQQELAEIKQMLLALTNK